MYKLLLLFPLAFLINACEKLPADKPASNSVKSAEPQEEIYVPQNLEECFSELTKILGPEDIDKMKTEEEDDMALYHHGLGTWLRNNWGLWKGSRLSEWFNEKGIHHPDDMSGIILTSFWRHLNNKPIQLDKQIEFYKNYWETQRLEK